MKVLLVLCSVARIISLYVNVSALIPDFDFGSPVRLLFERVKGRFVFIVYLYTCSILQLNMQLKHNNHHIIKNLYMKKQESFKYSNTILLVLEEREYIKIKAK